MAIALATDGLLGVSGEFQYCSTSEKLLWQLLIPAALAWSENADPTQSNIQSTQPLSHRRPQAKSRTHSFHAAARRFSMVAQHSFMLTVCLLGALALLSLCSADCPDADIRCRIPLSDADTVVSFLGRLLYLPPSQAAVVAFASIAICRKIFGISRSKLTASPLTASDCADHKSRLLR